MPLPITGGEIDTSALTTTAKVDAHFNGNSYISERTASSWTTNAATVTYTPESGGDTLFTLSGIADTSKVKVSGSNNHLQRGGCQQMECYKKGSVSYLTGYTKAGYNLSSDKTSVSYDKGGSTTSLKLSGVAAKSTLPAVNKGVVKLSASNIDSNLKVNSGDGKDYIKLTGKAATLIAGNDKLYCDAGNDKLNSGVQRR